MFYSPEKNRNERVLTITGANLLVGKAPTKEKRCRITVRMILTGKTNVGAPEWLDAAYVYVAQHHQTVTPPEEFRGYQLQWNVDNLFGKKAIKSPKCIMRSFEISEVGDRENPDVACSFKIIAPFSKALWSWIGQYGGEEVYCKFEPGADNDADGSEEEGDEADEDEDEDGKPAKKEKAGKSGPKQLEAFHTSEADKERKSGTRPN